MQRMSQHHEGMLSTLSFVYKFALARGGLEERKASCSAGTRASEKEKHQDGRGKGRIEASVPSPPRAPRAPTSYSYTFKSIQIY